MKKRTLYLLSVILIIFLLIPGIIPTYSPTNKLFNINSYDKNLNNACLAKESKIIIILQINNKYMTVNGVKKEIDPGRGTVPVIIKGRTLVPIRAIIEELGGTIDWDSNAKKVTIKFKNTTIELWIDKTIAKVDGLIAELDVAPQIINGRTMLPIRFVTEELGCTVDWNDKTKTITITYEEKASQVIDKLSSSGEKVFTSIGGELTLSDGTKLSVPKNAFSKDAKVTLKSIINPSFSCLDTLGFELTGLKDLKGEITLSVTGKKDLKDEELNVFGYDFEDDEKIDLKYSYASSSGVITVKINPLASTQTQKNLPSSKSSSESNSFSKLNSSLNSSSETLGLKDKLSAYIGWVPYYTPKSSEKIIRMPYYEQIGGSCASTCAQMLLKKGNKDVELFEILKELDVKDSDFGLGSNPFKGENPYQIYKYAWTLRDFLSDKLGCSVIHIPYFGIPHLKWRILSELDMGHPVILNWGKHVVVVLGYTGGGSEIIVHDPQNISPANNENGTMYTVRSWDWIKKRHEIKTEKYYILYADCSFATGSNLTLNCPANNETGAMEWGDLSFYVFNKNDNKYHSKYYLQIKPSVKPDGYIWVDSSKDKLSYIPNDAERLKLSLTAFNGSEYERDIEIQSAIEENKDGMPGKKIISNNKKLTIAQSKLNSSTKASYGYEYKLEDIKDLTLSDKEGKQKILIHCTLWEGTSLRDYFIINATLLVTPKVVSINPTTGKGGDTITINGFSFGKNKSTKSKVTINGENVDIVSWSDKEIKVKLPQDITSGPVIVYTGEKYEYESNKDVVFSTVSNCDKAYEIYCPEVPSWNTFDCKWDDSKQLIKLCVTFKDGKIFGRGPTCYSSSQEVSGTYDNSGNINFTFTWKSSSTDDTRGFIVTGNFTGTFVKGCTFNGTAKGTVRAYDKSPAYCKAYDVKKEFTSPMYDKNYKP